jgi:MYXO-CTERM domain-containing protein
MMKRFRALIMLALVCSSSTPSFALPARPTYGRLRDVSFSSTILDDGKSPTVCVEQPSGAYRRYRDARKVLTVKLDIVEQPGFVPPLPDAGVDDAGPAADADKPFSNGSLEVTLKQANGTILETQTMVDGLFTSFTQLGAEVCVKGLKDAVARGAATANAPTVEFCKPVTITDLSVTAAEKAAHDADVKQSCAQVEATNAAAKGDAGADAGASSGSSASGSGCNVGGTGNGGALLGVFAALGLTLLRRRSPRRNQS